VMSGLPSEADITSPFGSVGSGPTTEVDVHLCIV